MTYDDYLKQIITFNSDKDIITLRERFNQPSFFEMISRERSETTYRIFEMVVPRQPGRPNQ